MGEGTYFRDRDGNAVRVIKEGPYAGQLEEVHIDSDFAYTLPLHPSFKTKKRPGRRARRRMKEGE